MWFLSLGNWEYSNLLEGKYKVYILLSIMLHILWIWRFSSTIKKKEEKKMRIFPLQNLEFKSVGSTFAKVLGS